MPQPTRSNRAREAMGMEAPPSNGGGRPSTSTEVDVVENRIARTRLMQDAFADAMPRGQEKTMILRDAITALRTTPLLARCTEESFFGALMTAAQLGLRPNVGSTGHGWVLPFRNNRKNIYEATWILGYQGMVELTWRSGLVAGISAHTIFENEKWSVRYGTDDGIAHDPLINDTANRGAPIAHYASVRMLNGGNVWTIMGHDEVMAIKARSQAARDGKGPWFDDELPMARKTALRANWRFMPKSPTMEIALERDDSTRLFDPTKGVDIDDVAPEQQDPPMGPAETITVTRAQQPDATAETVDATPADPEPKPRRKAPHTSNRRELLRELEEKHGPRMEEAVRHASDDAHQGVPFDYRTDDELRAGIAFDLQAYDDAQIDAAAAKDGL